MESVIRTSSKEVNLPSHGQVTEGSILKAVLLLQLFRQLTWFTDNTKVIDYSTVHCLTNNVWPLLG